MSKRDRPCAECGNDYPYDVDAPDSPSNSPVWCPTCYATEAARPPFVTKDSGEREQHATGAQRDTRAGKGRYDLLPPAAIRRWAQLMERGAAKYGDRNWEKGMPLSRMVDSAARHLFQLAAGDADEDHAAAVLFNVGAVIEYRERIARGELPVDLDDLPGNKGKAAAT